MKLHRNAKTSPRMRQLIVTRIEQGWTQPRAAEAAGVSVRTVAKWLARRRAGDVALADGPSRPRQSPRRLDPVVTATILALRQQRATSWEISGRLGVPRSTVTRVLARAGLNRLRLLEPKPVVQRYEWPHAGDLVHLDIKPLGRIRGGVGHRIHGDRHRQQKGAGWEYVHVAVDDATRVAYVEVRRSQRRRACEGFVRRALQWFSRRGIRVRRILTDNGPGYCSRPFARACRVWQVRHKRTRPYTPRTNGKAERFIQTLLREWAYRRAYMSSAARTRALARFVRYYNHQRPHSSLGRRSPWTRFQQAA
jgi:transposase InsO family protein